jgi:Kef-type K+ transport system membrane component KefB
MTEGVSLLPVGALFVAVWVAGELFALVRAPLVGQIVVGLVLGPGLLDVVPHADALALVGLVGLLLLVEGGGLHMDLNTLRVVGWRAVGVGITGTALPVLAGWGLFLLLGFDSTTGYAAIFLIVAHFSSFPSFRSFMFKISSFFRFLRFLRFLRSCPQVEGGTWEGGDVLYRFWP